MHTRRALLGALKCLAGVALLALSGCAAGGVGDPEEESAPTETAEAESTVQKTLQAEESDGILPIWSPTLPVDRTKGEEVSGPFPQPWTPMKK